MKIDLVFPKGRHSWNFQEGFAYTLIRKGLLGHAYRLGPEDTWNFFRSVQTQSKADAFILMGGDHHLYFLHDTPEKKREWANLLRPIFCYCYESVKYSRFPHSMEKTRSAIEAFDYFGYADEADEPVFADQRPALWMPQFVDDALFTQTAALENRKRKVFFRGKTDTSMGYQDRRASLTTLDETGLLEHSSAEVEPKQYAQFMGSCVAGLNPAGNFFGLNVRAFETLASGTVLLQQVLENRPKATALFRHGEHLLYFRNAEELTALARAVCAAPERFAAIAENGRRACREHHTIDRRIGEILDFIGTDLRKSSVVHAGCGDNVIRGAINIDVRRDDVFIVRDSIDQLRSLGDGSISTLYCCHALEHFFVKDVPGVLAAWNRKMKRGGTLYLSVPDFQYLAESYVKGMRIEQILPPLFGGQDYKENVHYCSFDERYLSGLLRQAGFGQIERFDAKNLWFTTRDCSRWDLSLNLKAVAGG